jgi:hypothetical protein
MKNFMRVVIMSLAMLPIATTVGAADASKKDAAALEDSRQAVAWKARNANGADRQLLREEEQRLQDLIDGLQRGDKVDQAEIDRVLGRTR